MKHLKNLIAAFAIVAAGGFTTGNHVAAAATDNIPDTAGTYLVNGHILYADGQTLPAQPAMAPTGFAAGAAVAAAAGTVTSVPEWSSRPASTHTIYLDFDGANVVGTSWNINTGNPTMTTDPYDIDGNPSSYNSDEVSRMYTVWAQTADAFSAFDVNVTTKNPGDAALRKDGAGDTQYGVWVLIGPNRYFPSTFGGVAWLGSINWPVATPVYVLTDALWNDQWNIGSVVEHETGHAFGLSHDGNSTSAYDGGHGDWYPIMGAGYGRSIGQWSKGDYQDANNHENDINIIASSVGWAPDQDGNTQPVTIDSTHILQTGGVITNQTNVDHWKVTTSGPITITATSPAARPMMQTVITVTDVGGNQIPTSGTATGANSTSTQAATAVGTYTISIDGGGVGTWATGGWDDYSSIGAYTLVVRGGGNIAPTLSLAGNPTTAHVGEPAGFHASGNDQPGDTLTYGWDWGDGSQSAGQDATHTWAQPGIWVITATATDMSQAVTTSRMQIAVGVHTTGLDPVARAVSNPASGPAPLTFTIDASQSYDPDGTITDWDFNLGGGSGMSGPYPDITLEYNTPGTYVTWVKVTDNQGNQYYTPVTTIVTANHAPAAAIAAGSGWASIPTQFDASSSADPDGQALTYTWNWGDGTGGEGIAPTHTYARAGTYVATVIATDPGGLSSQAAVSVTVGTPRAVKATMAAGKTSRKHSETVTVTVTGAGRKLAGARVTVIWGGRVQGSSTGTTDRNGRVSLVSPTMAKYGTITATVTAISGPSGWKWNKTRMVASRYC